MLPDAAFPDLIADYVHLRDVLADENTRPDLPRSVRQFHRDSLAGRYYQDFMVNSRNYLEKSRGTETFIAEHSRLVEACLRAEHKGERETAAEDLGLLIDLMREIDGCERDVVFFADEAGSWQVGVLWDRVLPAWFRSLSPTTEAYEWAEAVVDALNALPATRWTRSSLPRAKPEPPSSERRWRSTRTTFAGDEDERRGPRSGNLASR